MIKKCRESFSEEIRAGRMLGRVGWTRQRVEDFLGEDVYTIPFGSVRKGDDPHGRIVHDYSYSTNANDSINSALLDNSVQASDP